MLMLNGIHSIRNAVNRAPWRVIKRIDVVGEIMFAEIRSFNHSNDAGPTN